jgi:hypothetical protein
MQRRAKNQCFRGIVRDVFVVNRCGSDHRGMVREALELIETLIQLYAKKFASMFAMILGIGIWAGCARWITNSLRSAFGFSDDVETVILGVSFFALPFIGYWLFGRYDNWQTERKFRSLINAHPKAAHRENEPPTPPPSEIVSTSAARAIAMRILRLKNANLSLKPEHRRFMIGMLCGGALIAIVWGGSAWWNASPNLSSQNAAIYDNCLLAQGGNTISCDAFMRMVERSRIKSEFLKTEGAKMRADGVSKRDVVTWAIGMGGVGSQLSDAAGISLTELQSDKY